MQARDLNPYLLGRGIASATTSEVADILGIPAAEVKKRMAPLRGRGEFVCPAKGLWVPVPSDKHAWGAPEPWAYIDAMMGHLGRRYCVGWLTAAALHGAGHQAAQVFQVAVSEPLRDREVGRSRLRFCAKANVGDIPSQTVSLPAGRARIATPEACALMVAEGTDLAGGLDNAATVVVELAESESFSVERLAAAAGLFSKAAARRVGWILDEFAPQADTSPLESACGDAGQSVSYLDPHAARAGSFCRRWNLIVNRKVEPDL